MGCILVADDDPAIRALLRELLSDEGYEVVEAADGRAAVELALSLHPQVVLMDLRMPQLDGMEATREIKADPRGAGVRVIAMSAGYNLRTVAEQLPADSLIAKPFDLDALLADVAVQLNHAQSGTPRRLLDPA
jgi:CheY-like chemotaxis protein